MTDEWPMLLLSALFGLWGAYAAYAFKAGRLKRSARWYFDRTQPAYVRNLPFIALPASIFFWSGALVLGLHQLRDIWAEAIVAAAGLAALGALIIGLVWSHRPPKFLKPAWLETEEQRRAAGET